MERFIAGDCPVLAISLMGSAIWQESAVVPVEPGSASLGQRQEDFSSWTCLDADADGGVCVASELADTVNRNG